MPLQEPSRPWQTAPPFLRGSPPWYARTTGWVILSTAAAALLFSVTVRMPVAIEGRFTMDDARAGAIDLPQSAFSGAPPGQIVELHYDALPFARWGAGRGRVIDSRFERGRLRVHFEAASGALGGGATGTARIVLRKRTLLDRALEPLRELGARWSDTATPPLHPSREESS
ncbi:hypothetical protein [Pendulispora albinea]|uniref:Uncharacterized protein n=1 Tax=Pendulispora albinea TaxID=2741071 RepID=A0ABZ2LPT4_9BACT